MDNTINTIDSRLKLLSNSSLSLLHSCARKYQLKKLWPEYIREETVHTSYGKFFGAGIQYILSGDSFEDAIIKASTEWKLDLYDEEKEKTFWHCFNAIETFSIIRHQLDISDYEVVMFNNKPACELSFCIDLENGFYYRGYIDILMQHKLSGELLVVDAKTSNARYTNPAKYQNSAQAISYSIVIDAIFSNTSGFNVLYFEYLTGLNKFEHHLFYKDYLERATWIRDILIDCEIMNLYSRWDSWPKNGNACTNYGRTCEFIDNCMMETANLIGSNIITKDAIELDKEANKTYDINVTLSNIIESQLGRN